MAIIESSDIATFSNVISEQDCPSIVEKLFCDIPSDLVSTKTSINSLLCIQVTITLAAFDPLRTRVLVPFNFMSETSQEGEL